MSRSTSRPTQVRCCAGWFGALALALAAVPGCQQVTASSARAPDPPATTAIAAPPPAAAETSFVGTWRSSYGLLRLAPGAGGLTGSYTQARGSRLEGSIDGRRLRGTYHEPSPRGGGVDGRFTFELAADGESFRGVWAEGVGAPLDLDDPTLQRWTGQRARGEPGRVWLVILEAHWEGSLREREYSFGAMLRSFFERVPTVAVRHRFVHDLADFERFTAELAELVEPVWLYVSAHGSPEAVAIGQGGISPEQLGAALRNVGDLRLLHLGACAMLAGDAPARIVAAAAPHPPFPISGFVESVDWAASAIVDFTYLAQQFERGMTPRDAVQATRAMLSFAREPAAAEAAAQAAAGAGGLGGLLPGCDLRLFEVADPAAAGG
ncbi:MAG: hypothetical protein FJ293_17310 [Planctomycetes bacterium]|nr:hypothetical protein [Planctomycetota bacterium]